MRPSPARNARAAAVPVDGAAMVVVAVVPAAAMAPATNHRCEPGSAARPFDTGRAQTHAAPAFPGVFLCARLLAEMSSADGTGVGLWGRDARPPRADGPRPVC